MESKGYYIDESGAFVIEDYHQKRPFASFLPAIAGIHGKPMWAYYVNRGQCVATFGVNNKDYAIMEFQPAVKAYRQTSLQGFRTFLKIRGEKGGTVCYEPFHDPHLYPGLSLRQRMYITSHDLRIEEINESIGLRTEVTYATLPGERLAALIRTVRLTNLTGHAMEIEMLDGMPMVIPYFISDSLMKNECNLRQAWMCVDHCGGIPFYNVKVLPVDAAETVLIEGGNFYLNFTQGPGGQKQISPTLINPVLVFGAVTDLSYPEAFFDHAFSMPEEQASVGFTPCGFGYRHFTLPAGAQDTAHTLIGSAESCELLAAFADTLDADYIGRKLDENKRLIEEIKQNALTVSGSREFDLYTGQSFLDNTLRGGLPIRVGGHVFYVYSRKHGDLEREYNFFQVDATYYSQGNSNFRDVNQNRRNSIRFFPYVGETDIKTFFNLIQLDGFNPLVLKGAVFTIDDREAAEAVIRETFWEAGVPLMEHIRKPFTPGSLLGVIDRHGLDTGKAADGFMDRIFAMAQKSEAADFHEGYWVDHWTYNTDLLEQYIAVYPDRVMETLFDENACTYYDPYMMVAPRERKYVLTDRGVRQYNALVKNTEKERLIKGRDAQPHAVRKDAGRGDIYRCSLVSKILCLLVNKMASLDAAGVGIEMEADRPGWCDALNGLPGILGSSINETAEVKRLALLLLDLFREYRVDGAKEVNIPMELYRFYDKVRMALLCAQDDFTYWDLTCIAKEEYREAVAWGIGGRERAVTVTEIESFLGLCVSRLDRGLQKAFDREAGLYHTYFINEALEYEPVKDQEGNPVTSPAGYPYVRVKKFTQRPIPYFLEGNVHMLRIETDPVRAVSIHQAIKKTGLYDPELKMYKVNDYIMEETKEIGRQNAFPRGWLENEAVFLHMEYKYLLELLRCGLYDTFFAEMKHALIPFQDPAVYGRSILENSSFIASSAHPNKRVHGTGYQSRLTGASAEFLHMWLLMTQGKKPFFLDAKGDLCLRFAPLLPGWLFTGEEREIILCRDGGEDRYTLPPHAFAFRFLSDTLAVYHNPGRKDTFGEGAARILRMTVTMKDGTQRAIEGDTIPSPLAEEIREGAASRIEAKMG